MTKYIIQRTTHGWRGYLLPPGGKKTYSKSRRHARVFDTQDEARREALRNERVVPVEV